MLFEGHYYMIGWLVRRIAIHKIKIMPLKDITNTKFGYLAAVKYVKSRDGNGAIWECICDCGNICEVRSHSLLRGKTKSCGCKSAELISIAVSKETGSSNITQLFNTYKQNAKLRGYCFELSLIDFSYMIVENCYYCGIGPSQKLVKSNIQGARTLLYNDIDRIDNTKGYMNDNVITACGQCNFARGDRIFVDFIKWIDRASKHLSERKII